MLWSTSISVLPALSLPLLVLHSFPLVLLFFCVVSAEQVQHISHHLQLEGLLAHATVVAPIVFIGLLHKYFAAFVSPLRLFKGLHDEFQFKLVAVDWVVVVVDVHHGGLVEHFRPLRVVAGLMLLLLLIQFVELKFRGLLLCLFLDRLF